MTQELHLVNLIKSDGKERMDIGWARSGEPCKRARSTGSGRSSHIKFPTGCEWPGKSRVTGINIAVSISRRCS